MQRSLNIPQALAELVAIREQASQRLGEWSHAQFQTKRLTIERLLAQGDVQAVYQATQQLLQQCEQAGAKVYVGADYDLAIANLLLGRVLGLGGASAEALAYLQTAQQAFEALGESGAGMASVSLAEQGNYLADLGKLDQAVVIYQEGLKCSEKLKDIRGIAVTKTQLATTYMLQKEYTKALQGYQEALGLFQQLNEPSAVATIHHQTANMYKEQGQFKQAETAYRQSLSMKTKQKNRAGEASSLNELANLYGAWNRPEQSVDYYRQAADIYTQISDLRYEGVSRSNLANTLIKLNRLTEARSEILRAIECNKSFEFWKIWSILYDLELADNNPQAAQQARQKAINTFLAYRRDGGENHDGAGRLALSVLQAIQQGDTTDIEQTIVQLLEREGWKTGKAYLHQLQAIIAGGRTPIFGAGESCDVPAGFDDMHYQQVVELKLLLEQLSI